jgi:hypothetical protein
MTDKRNIIIKVSYPVAGKATENAAPKMVTEWNVKRILFAAGALVLMLVLLIYGINNDAPKTDVDNAAVMLNQMENPVTPQVEVKAEEVKALAPFKQAAVGNNPLVKPNKEANKKNKPTTSIPVKETIKKQLNEKAIKGHSYLAANHNVSRALLTYAINNKEPTDEMVKPVNLSHKKQPVWLYYFTELKAMKGSRVYHEWLKNGVVVTRQELVISDDTWRTSSRKLLSDREKGSWSVRLVDEKGRLLNEKKFKVE